MRYHWLNGSPVARDLRVTGRANVSEQCYAALAREKCCIGQHKQDSLCEVIQLFIRTALAAMLWVWVPGFKEIMDQLEKV